MRKISNLGKLILVLALTGIFSGYAQASLTDIETSILRGRYDEVEPLVAEYLQQNPSLDHAFEARYYLGLSYLHRKQYDQARTIFEELKKEKLDSILRDKAYLGLLDSYYMNEQYMEALRVGDDLLKASPKSEFLSLIYLKLGRSNLKLSNWRQAQQYLRKIVRRFPKSLEYYSAKQLLE